MFSNFYLPIELKKITYNEKKIKYREYTKEELSQKIQENIRTKLISENDINEDNIIQEIPTVTVTDSSIKVKFTIVYEGMIGIRKSK